jgi:FMN phosphatase YigB (HAD superfamily)
MYDIKSPGLKSSNLNIHSKFKSVKTKLVITDVDGTLASFWDYFVPAMRDFLRDLSVRSNKNVLELAQDIGHIIERRGSHEYPWLLEETSYAWTHYSKDPEAFREEYVRPFWDALDVNRSKYLHAYPRVLDTLAELKERGIKIVALSDAPEYMARVRNQQVFDGLLDAVYSLETVEPDKDEVFRPISLEHGRERVQQLRESTANLKTALHILPQLYEKPCPYGLDQILSDFEVFPQECLFVGDSLAKDGMVAASRGIPFIWAHYGTSLPAEYEEMVNSSLKPPVQDRFHRTLPQELITAVAARYDEILHFVD